MDYKTIEQEVKGTIGYAEAEDKASFLIGASVAFARTQDYYMREMEILRAQLLQYRSSSENYYSDLKTMSSIIERYSA
jgi:hypothetical protein